ncbi:MAG: S8/S53 family peptidase [bacterium]|nr:S8/S53 family peptidase [bacterium]
MKINSYTLNYRFAIIILFLLIPIFSITTTTQEPPQTYHVIIQLKAPFQPEGNLAGINAVQFQRAAISRSQSTLINTLRAQNLAIFDVIEYETIPYMALEVDAAGLLALQTNPNVTQIVEDRLSEVTMTSANVVVDSPSAWAKGFDGTGYAVAVLDTGVDFTHPVLSSKRLAEACFSRTNTSATTSCPAGINPSGLDSQVGFGAAMPKLPPACAIGCDHGTHIAGIAAGNGIGKGGIHESYRGVAPGAQVIGINVFSIFSGSTWCGVGKPSPCPLTYDSDQIRALEHVYSLRNSFPYPIVAVNMSLGRDRFYSPCDANVSASYLSIVSNLKMAGIAVVAGSGNDSYTDSLRSPACITDVVSVGAIYDNGTVTNFSNTATFLDLLAPGFGVTSPGPGGIYQDWQGTSVATPFVTGAWAIMRQAYPTAGVDEILNLLVTNGIPVLDTRPVVDITKPRIRIGASIVIGEQLRMNEQELMYEMTAQLQPSHQIGSVLADFYSANGGGINLWVILKDGTVVTTTIRIVTTGTLSRVILGQLLVNGSPASSAITDVMNTEVPSLLMNAIYNFTAPRMGDAPLFMTSFSESDMILTYMAD